MRSATAAIAAILLVAVAGCTLVDPTSDGWVFPTPYPLPSGAVAVPIQAAEFPRPVPPDVEVIAGCATLELPSFRVEYREDDPTTPVWYRFGFDEYRTVIWGYGVSARLNPGLEIVGADGTVIARDREWSRGFFGTDLDGVVRTCAGSGQPHRVGETPRS